MQITQRGVAGARSCPPTVLMRTVGAALEPPRRVGPYAVGAPLAATGRQRFHHGHAPCAKPVVLERIPHGPDWTAVRRRLIAEARFLDDVGADESGVAPIRDVIEDGGTTWVVRPHLSGVGLQELLDGGRDEPCELRERLARMMRLDGPGAIAAPLLLVERLARIVHALHERGRLHLELAPGRVLLRPGGRPVLLNLGAAWDVDPARRTDVHLALPRVIYAARERVFQDAACIGPATDVYGLGAILYRLLAGHAPHEGSSLESLLLDIGSRPATPIRVHDPALPEALAAVCDRAVHAVASERYPTAAALADDLARVRAGRLPRGVRVSVWGRLAALWGRVQGRP